MIEANGARLSGEALRQALALCKEKHPGIRARDAARELGVSEAELVACRVGNGVVRLDADFADVLRAAPSLGRVMVLTRNEHCVHEKHGVFDHVSIGPGHGIVLNHDVDLRLFMSHWRFGFAVTEEVQSGTRSSLQFFDIDGTAVHKIYAVGDTDRAAYDALVERFKAPTQTAEIEIAALPARLPDRPDDQIDIATFRKHWRALQDTHDFFGLLQEFGVGRAQAMRLAEREFAYPIETDAFRAALERCATDTIPIMCFVGNSGCIQIHTGPIQTLKIMGPWFNILDPSFNLHLREDAVAEAWVVRKPTRDGIVTSLELFDREGHCFVQFFGERKPGKTELESWREAVAALVRADGPGEVAADRTPSYA
ncbi:MULTISPECIES: ChuX/HutX family heme-like substrate-binding protein [Rhodomicrobium]|uniref:hemin-degrading factor n=1 Tax=Rhodomicrobium TaxID=1068 RepID=UPI000B4B2B70|nr:MULTISPECIES: ChuX/HutX family heme-like substrate-binding protein [Rhodomicrobium]